MIKLFNKKYKKNIYKSKFKKINKKLLKRKYYKLNVVHNLKLLI